MMNCVLS